MYIQVYKIANVTTMILKKKASESNVINRYNNEKLLNETNLLIKNNQNNTIWKTLQRK